MPIKEWDHIARSLALRPSHDANLIIHHPMLVWPFEGRDAVPDAAIAADLLHSAEPRAVRAGQLRLNKLLKDLRRGTGR